MLAVGCLDCGERELAAELATDRKRAVFGVRLGRVKRRTGWSRRSHNRKGRTWDVLATGHDEKHASREIAQRAKGLTGGRLSLSQTCVTVPGEVFWG